MNEFFSDGWNLFLVITGGLVTGFLLLGFRVLREDPDFHDGDDEDDLEEIQFIGGVPLSDVSDEFSDDLRDVLDDIIWKENDQPEPLAKIRVTFSHVSDGDSGAYEKSDEAGEFSSFCLEDLVSISLNLIVSKSNLGRMAIEATEFIELLKDDPESGKFRIIGADTFELAQGEMGILGQIFAQELLQGRTGEIWFYGYDIHGRALVAIHLPVELVNRKVYDVDWAKLIVRLGVGIRYAGSKHEEGAWYQVILDPLQAEAEAERLGYWGLPKDERPELPHIFRAKNRRGNSRRNTYRHQLRASGRR